MTAAARRQFCGLPDPSGEQGTLRAFWNSEQDRCFPCSARMCLLTACPAVEAFLPSAPRGCAFVPPALRGLPSFRLSRGCAFVLSALRGCASLPARGGEDILALCPSSRGRFYFFAVLLPGLSFCFQVFVRQVCRWSSFSMSAPSEGKNTSAPGCGREKALLCRSAQDPFRVPYRDLRSTGFHCASGDRCSLKIFLYFFDAVRGRRLSSSVPSIRPSPFLSRPICAAGAVFLLTAREGTEDSAAGEQGGEGSWASGYWRPGRPLRHRLQRHWRHRS